MRSHPDFGRGRLRYNRENKKRIDELWEEVTSALNCAGCGPQKLPKEWAKTWRDWKSNLLKRVATYKSYSAGTGGGPPKTLDTSPSEDDLLEFLTPEASGMSDIPEGGAIGDNNVTSTYSTARKTLTSQNLQDSPICQTKEFLTSQSSQIKKTSCFQRSQDMTSSLHLNAEENLFDSDVINVDDTENLPINISSNVLASIGNIQIPKKVHCQSSSTISKNKRYSDDRDIGNKKIKQNWQTTKETSQSSQIQKTSCFQRPQDTTSFLQPDAEENLFDNDIMNDDTDNLSINISSNVLASTENVQIPKQVHCQSSSTISKNKRYSDDRDTGNKKTKQNVKQLFEQHTADYCSIQNRTLQLKEEKLTVAKEELELKKQTYQERNELLTSLIEKVDELTNAIRSIAPQYLE
ncbi:uncharacterized protein [Temnothorax nylanderi]|uniref:uncharacterized protein n=1 Tax=Temnothorax nylanderi TaxID=102681 RepID=UPI003A88FB2C